MASLLTRVTSNMVVESNQERREEIGKNVDCGANNRIQGTTGSRISRPPGGGLLQAAWFCGPWTETQAGNLNRRTRSAPISRPSHRRPCTRPCRRTPRPIKGRFFYKRYVGPVQFRVQNEPWLGRCLYGASCGRNWMKWSARTGAVIPVPYHCRFTSGFFRRNHVRAGLVTAGRSGESIWNREQKNRTCIAENCFFDNIEQPGAGGRGRRPPIHHVSAGPGSGNSTLGPLDIDPGGGSARSLLVDNPQSGTLRVLPAS